MEGEGRGRGDVFVGMDSSDAGPQHSMEAWIATFLGWPSSVRERGLRWLAMRLAAEETFEGDGAASSQAKTRAKYLLSDALVRASAVKIDAIRNGTAHSSSNSSLTSPRTKALNNHSHSSSSSSSCIDFLDSRIVPSPICRHILEFCDLKSLGRASCVSRYWRRRLYKTNADWIWKAEFKRLHMDSTFLQNLEMDGKTWRVLCQTQELSRLGWMKGDVEKAEFTGHRDRVRHVRIRQDTVVSASWDQTLRMIDVGEEIANEGRNNSSTKISKEVALHGGSVFGVWFDGQIAVTCSEDSTIKIWFVHRENEKKKLVGHSHPVYRVAMISSETLVSCSRDFVGVWHWPSETLSRRLVGHTHDVHRIQVCGNRIVTGSYDSTVRVWSYPSCEVMWASPRVHKSGVSCLHFHNGLLATGSAKGEVFFWELDTGNALSRSEGHEHYSKTVSCIMVSDDKVFSMSNLSNLVNDGVLCIWDALTGVLIQRIHESFHTNAVTKDFGMMFCACSDGILRIRNPEREDLRIVTELVHGSMPLYDVDVQGHRAVTCGLDKTVVVWTLKGIQLEN